jgi:hypothetical protein
MQPVHEQVDPVTQLIVQFPGGQSTVHVDPASQVMAQLPPVQVRSHVDM